MRETNEREKKMRERETTKEREKQMRERERKNK